jgi:hypothetical protein
MMNLIEEVEMVNADYSPYEPQVILNLQLNYDYVIVIQLNEVTGV